MTTAVRLGRGSTRSRALTCERRPAASPLNVRGEYQHAPGFPGLPSNVLAGITNYGSDVVTPTDVNGLGTRDNFRLIDATISAHVLHHEISFGKSEMWWGPDARRRL